MHPVLVTPPASAPVEMTELLNHCRLQAGEDDEAVDGFLAAAVAYLDGWRGILGRCMITQTWDVTYQASAYRLRLPFPDVQSVVVKCRDADGIEQTIDAAQHTLSADAFGSLVYFRSGLIWPTLDHDMPDPIKVTIVAGFGAVHTAVPENLKQAIKMMVAHWLRCRELGSPELLKEIPMGFTSLIAPYRHIRL